MSERHIAVFMYNLAGGGVARRNITLANALAADGARVDMLVVDASGELRTRVAPSVRVVELGGVLSKLPWIRTRRRRQFRVSLRPLVAYLARERPSVVLSSDNYANLTAIRAREIALVSSNVVVSQRNHTTVSAAGKKRLIDDIARHYHGADAIVAVSEGVGRDLVSLGLPADKIETIYNPIVDEDLKQAAQAPVDHPWFHDNGAPLIVAVGRLTPQKDFATLIRSFALLHSRGGVARLVILGDGKTPDDRRALLKLAADLGVADAVSCPGYVENAVAYIARARLFVLSSAWEGLGAVVVEALACGTPVVSTDCPSGPAEILAYGEYGRLVPVGDAEAMAAAIYDALKDEPRPEPLKARAEHFTTKIAMRRYLDLFDRLSARTRSTGG